MRKPILCLLLTALLAGSALADGPVYKWVDKDGHVHYSTVPHSLDAKPTGITNTTKGMAPSAGTVAGSPTPADALPTISPGDSAACKAAKQKLSQYLSADVLYTQLPDGKQKKLSKDEQAKVVQRARNDVTVACTPPES
ncbi:MAG TPA: DUF4124 domain-containing protein [Gammaproteobacteria bacterium]|nr:DUF4124 domain-containing protein [Gammaproteobacteria bacterium]